MSNLEFNELLLGNEIYLKTFAVNLTRDHESARDLLQETFYRALLNREKYSFGTNIKAWLYTIMRNVFINDYRRRIRQPVILDHSSNDFLLNREIIVSNSAESHMNLKEIKTAIYHLPIIFRSPFVMHFEGYKYSEIAGILKEPIGTIKSRIHFARKIMKQKLSR